MCHPHCVVNKYILLCIMYYTYSHNTTILSMGYKLLHWVQLHVSALGISHHQVVLSLFEQLYNAQGTLGGVGVVEEGDLIPPPSPLPPVYPAYCIVARKV